MTTTPPCDFTPFPKIPRLFRPVVITEKIDGTNASVLITESGDVFAASRNRWITPADDNYGFAKFVEGNKETFLQLGPGHHFGEWWGLGIQRGYGLNEKRFSLFNVSRWEETPPPAGLYVVPAIMRMDLFDSTSVWAAVRSLSSVGSFAAPGFMDPEGVVVYHTAANMCFKVTIKNDDTHKGAL